MLLAIYTHDAADEIETEVECATLDEALCHLEHVIRSEIEAGGHALTEFTIRHTAQAPQRQVWQPRKPSEFRPIRWNVANDDV